MTKHENILFVPVPEGAHGIEINTGSHSLDWFTGDLEDSNSVDLPPGSWRFIDLHSQMTEENAREVVSNLFERSYRNYELPEDHSGWGGPYVYDTALESYHSLYRHLGLVGEQAVLINTTYKSKYPGV